MALTIINLSDQVSALVTKTNDISTDLGDVANLLNGATDVVVAANKIGTLSSLNRSASDLVSAINLVDAALTSTTGQKDSDYALFQNHYDQMISRTDSNHSESVALDARLDVAETDITTIEGRLDNHDSDFGDLASMRQTVDGANDVAEAIEITYNLLTSLDSDLVDLSDAITATSREAISATNSGTGFGSISYNNTSGVITFAKVTSANIRAQLSASDAGGDGSFSYNSSTGAFTYTGPSATETRAHFSAVDAGGDGSFSYNAATGAFTYTGPSAAEVRAHFSAGTGISIANGVISGTNASTTEKGIASFNSNFFTTSGGQASIKNASINTAQLANDAVDQEKLKDVVSLIIYNSAGSALKTIYGAGS